MGFDKKTFDMPFLIVLLFYLGGVGSGILVAAGNFYAEMFGGILGLSSLLYVLWLYSHSLKGCELVVVKEKKNDGL